MKNHLNPDKMSIDQIKAEVLRMAKEENWPELTSLTKTPSPAHPQKSRTPNEPAGTCRTVDNQHSQTCPQPADCLPEPASNLPEPCPEPAETCPPEAAAGNLAPQPHSQKNLPRSPLDRLPPEDQQFILNLLINNTVEKARHILKHNMPRSLQVLPSETALKCFRRRAHAREELQFQTEDLNLAREIIADPDMDEAAFLRATARILKRRILANVIDSSAGVKTLSALYNIHHRTRQLDLAERKLALLEKSKKPVANVRENTPTSPPSAPAHAPNPQSTPIAASPATPPS